MKEVILHTPKNLSFAKRIVKYLPQAIRSGLPAEIAIVTVSTAESRALNRQYRKKNASANVLSFLYSDTILSSPRKRGSRVRMLDSRVRGNDKRSGEKDRTYGEIIVCPGIIRAEAKAEKHRFQYQMTWMILHGMIHLSGLHHEASVSTAERVGEIERIILSKLFKESGGRN